jgi:hypothetical protein
MKLIVDTNGEQVTVTKDPVEKTEQNGRQKTERNTGRLMWSTQVFVLDDDGGEVIAITPAVRSRVEPRNFGRSFDRCIGKAQVPRITVNGTPQDMRVPAGRPGRAPPCGHADPAAQQDRRHDGDRHRGPLGRYPRRAA